jgi:hypothetical protein
MDIRFLIEQLDEITRRGFLTNLGAAGGAFILGKTAAELHLDDKAKSKRLSRANIVGKLRRGSHAEEVKKILGSPDNVRRSMGITYYTYIDPLDADVTVYFTDENRVRSITKGWMNTIVDESTKSLEETSDDAIARIVELSKDRK